jgi:hypothetical protein
MHRRCHHPHPRLITVSVVNTQPGRRKCTTARAMHLETSMADLVYHSSSSSNLQPLLSSSLQDSQQRGVSQVSSKSRRHHTTHPNRSPSTSTLLGLARNQRIIHLMRQSTNSPISLGRWGWGRSRYISPPPIYSRRRQTLVSWFALLQRLGCLPTHVSRHRRSRMRIHHTSGAPSMPFRPHLRC